MKQTSGFISTYSADSFGVCSALYELGGMVVMHDASGCNSTYTTHDEPRWYDIDSMVYISALTEIEAIMGDDSRLINDIVEAAMELKPKFIAIAGTPIPAMTGFDAEAAAREIEERTGLPSFGFATTGMKSYVHGAGMAFKALAERFVDREYTVQQADQGNENQGFDQNKKTVAEKKINILGLTPLDFSMNGSDKSIIGYFEKQGYVLNSSWAMGTTLENVGRAWDADLDQVVSESGYEAAVVLKERFGIPFKIGIPIGGMEIDVTPEFEESIKKNTLVWFGDNAESAAKEDIADAESTEILVLGERAASLSLAKYLSIRLKKKCAAYAATDADEDEIVAAIGRMKGKGYVIADPLFKPALKLLPRDKKEQIIFISLPHEAFSGRMYRNEIPDLVSNANSILERIL